MCGGEVKGGCVSLVYLPEQVKKSSDVLKVNIKIKWVYIGN